MRKKRKKPLKPAVRMTLKADQIFLDRRMKRTHTRSQKKVQFRRELAGGGE